MLNSDINLWINLGIVQNVRSSAMGLVAQMIKSRYPALEVLCSIPLPIYRLCKTKQKKSMQRFFWCRYDPHSADQVDT